MPSNSMVKRVFHNKSNNTYMKL